MTARHRSRPYICLLTLTFLPAFPTHAAGWQVQLQGATIELDSIADQTHGHLEWSNGAFVYLLYGRNDPKLYAFYTFDREGKLVSSATPSIPDATQLVISSYGRETDGSIVFVGDFRADYTWTPYIGWVSADGQTSHIIKTAPYHPMAVAVTPDGTIWTVGMESIDQDRYAPGVNPEAPILRHFDQNGKLIGSGFPQSQFIGNRNIHRINSGVLAVANGVVGWYSPIDGAGDYVEVSTDTMTPHSYPGIPGNPLGMVMQFALTDSGDALVDYAERTVGSDVATYKLDRAARKWMPVQLPRTSDMRWPHLLGTDGDRLVLKGMRTAGFFDLVP